MRPIKRHGFGKVEWEPQRRKLWGDLGRYRREAKLLQQSKVFKTLMDLTSLEAGQRVEALCSIRRNLGEFRDHIKWVDLALRDPSPEVRGVAVSIFGLALEKGGRGVDPLPKLVFALGDPAAKVRSMAVEKIAIYAGDEHVGRKALPADAIKALSKGLKDPDNDVKMRTGFLFQAIGYSEPLLQSEDPFFQRMGREVLEKQKRK